MKRFTALPLLIVLLTSALCASAATKETTAPAAPAKDGPLTAQGAIAAAEKFIAAQRYTDLQPKSVGARAEEDVWFVGFRSVTGPSIRGIMVSENGKKLKRVNQNLQLDWLTSKPEETTELNAAGAAAIAKPLAAKIKGLSKKAVKTTENAPNKSGDAWNSWWVWFEKAGKPGAKPAYSIVSVNKKTRQTKWVKSDGKAGKP